MKNTFKQILTLTFVTFLIYSCSKEERFEGTPALNGQDVETIKGTIVSNTPFALPGQLIDFTVTLPSDFVARINQDVDVEVQTLTTANSLRKASVVVPKGQNTATGKVIVGGGGGTFFMPVVLKLSAVKLTTELPGKHFLLTSENVIVNSGSTQVSADDEKRMQIKIGWENQSTGNVLKCKISRLGSVAITLKGSTPDTGSIIINGTSYTLTYVNSLENAALDFVTLYGNSIKSANPGVFQDIYASGKAIIFNYVSPIPAVLPIFSLPAATPATTGIAGVNFSSAIFPSAGTTFDPVYYPVLNSQLTASSSAGLEGSAVYNEGTYQIAIQPSPNPGDLESNPIDLKYRIVIKMPDTSVKIFEGVYTNATPTSGYKNVLKFNKTGYGAAADYNAFIFTP